MNNSQKRFRDSGYFLKEQLLPLELLDQFILEIETQIKSSLQATEFPGRERPAPDTNFEKFLHWLEENVEGGIDVRKSVTGKHLKTSGLLEIATNNNILDIVEQLIGPEILFHPQYNIQAKMPFERDSQIPWHQDVWFLDKKAESTPMVNLWIPLVNTTPQNGCLELIENSHSLGIMNHVELPGYPPNHIGIQNPQSSDKLAVCPVGKGGAIFFHNRIIHRSRPNVTDRIRWSMDIRYSDATKPTGRDVPGLLVRSKRSPEAANPSLRVWLKLMETVTNQPYIC
tara:strand:+ start:1722 stop:2573 length:852 start_codon:yes stop_codon:yes gene_type:complete